MRKKKFITKTQTNSTTIFFSFSFNSRSKLLSFIFYSFLIILIKIKSAGCASMDGEAEQSGAVQDETKLLLNMDEEDYYNYLKEEALAANYTEKYEKEDFLKYNITDFTRCGLKFCMTDNGDCLSEFTSYCECIDEYTTYPETKNLNCTYKRKKQIIAFCLELFLFFGAGHFYIGNYFFGFLKLILFTLVLVLIFSLRIYNEDKEEYNRASLMINLFACIFFFLLLCWEIFDCLMFMLNKYIDNNEVSLFAFSLIKN